MPIFLDHARDLVRLGLLGTALFRLFGQGRIRSRVLERGYSSRKNIWHEGSEGAAIGFEASWAGIFPRLEKEQRSGQI